MKTEKGKVQHDTKEKLNKNGLANKCICDTL